MNLYFRFVWLLLRRVFLFKKISALDICTTKFWVNPLDLDINLHMNNGRYLSLMDLGRIDLMIKAKVFWKLMLKGYYPVVVSEGIHFKKSLMPFQRFEIHTIAESWDERDVFLQQKFYCKGQLVAEGYIKSRFRKRGRKSSLPTKETMLLFNEAVEVPQMSDKARALKALDEQLANQKKI